MICLPQLVPIRCQANHKPAPWRKKVRSSNFSDRDGFLGNARGGSKLRTLANDKVDGFVAGHDFSRAKRPQKPRALQAAENLIAAAISNAL